MTKRYIFASLSGPDFVIAGNDPEDAWIRLCEREKDNGSLWKTSCKYRNATAVKREGFSYLCSKNSTTSVAYKEI